MKEMSLTVFRSHLYQEVDEILETGIPKKIKRHGKYLLLIPEQKVDKLKNLKKHSCIIGDPDELVYGEFSEWNEIKNLKK